MVTQSRIGSYITSLLDTATVFFLQSSKSPVDARVWFVLQAFLWAEWHQTVLIQLSYDSKIQMKTGSAFDRHSLPMAMPGRETLGKSRPDYMCKWAFELL